MAKERSPAFRFYAKDWRDVKVRRMSLSAQGAYIAILADMWVDSKDQCSILDCDPFIAKSLGVPLKEWMALRGEIQHTDEPLLIQKDGRLYSQRLKDEVMKQRKYAEQQREKGVAGASKRWGKPYKRGHSTGIAQASSGHSTGIAEGMAGDSSSSSLSSSSSSVKRIKNQSGVNSVDNVDNRAEVTHEEQLRMRLGLGIVRAIPG